MFEVYIKNNLKFDPESSDTNTNSNLIDIKKTNSETGFVYESKKDILDDIENICENLCHADIKENMGNNCSRESGFLIALRFRLNKLCNH